MINRKEITIILVTSLILAFASTLVESLNYFLKILGFVFIVISANIFAKKIAAYFLESKIEIKLWQFRRWGYKKHQKFSKEFPAGLFIPIISKIILFPINGFVWMASLVFDAKPEKYRAAKRHGLYTFFEVNESHIGLIALSGIFINLLLAVISYLLNLPEFGRLNIWYAFFNMIPLSDLDGTKIYFGSRALWAGTAIITLIALMYSIVL